MAAADTTAWREKRRDLIRRTAQLLSSALSLPEILGQFSALLSDFIEASNVSIAIGDEHGAIEYSFAGGAGDRSTGAPVTNGSATHQVLKSGEPVLSPHLEGAAICVPVSFGGIVVGVLSVESRHAYDNDDVEMLESCAIYLGARIYDERSRAEKVALQQAAATDALTGIANRRTFDDALEREWRRCARSQSPLSVLVLDVDFFKGFNDRYGHIAGDGCLRQIAQAIASAVNRPGDVAARYGGEEFAVVLPETQAGEAAQVGETICAAVRALQIAHEGSSLGYVTVSIGCAGCIPETSGDPTIPIAHADTQLYRAKEHGRNRVACDAYVSESAAAQRRATLRHNLPSMRTSFLGRESELAGLAAQLEKAQLVTLAGPGGVGKSRLAIELGKRILERYPDGVWFFDLAPITDPQFLAPSLLATLGVPEESAREAVATLVTRLRENHMLLVFDNCEHLMKDVALLIDRLLRECPRVQVLATSQEVLKVSGESVERVASFNEDEGVALFAERAKTAAPSFSLTPENLETVKAICKCLDGIPLAIELAAARVKMMTIGELQKRLDDRFRVLTGGSRTAAARHQTLRGLIAWSYDLLDEGEKTLLRRLSIFAGEFSLDAATAVCSLDPIEAWEVMDLLAHLVDKSLVQSEPGMQQQRHRLLESTKEFARERLDEAGETASLQRCHAEYYGARVKEAIALRHSFGMDRVRLEIEREYAEYRFALQWALVECNDVALGAALALKLSPYWYERGQPREGLLWAQRVLDPGREALGLATWAQAQFALSAHYFSQGEYDLMEATASRAVEAYETLGDRLEHARGRNNLALAAYYSGRYAEAIELYESIVTAARDFGAADLEAVALANLADVYTDWKGDYETAERFHAQALELVRPLENSHRRASFLGDWSQTVAWQGAFDRADELVREALDIFRRHDNQYGIIEQSIRRGHYRVWAGDVDAARRYLGEAIAVLRTAQHPREIARFAEACTELAIVLQAYECAAELCGFSNAWRKSKNLARAKPTHERLEGSIAKARAALGGDAFASAYETGCNLTPDSALDLASSLLT